MINFTDLVYCAKKSGLNKNEVSLNDFVFNKPTKVNTKTLDALMSKNLVYSLATEGQYPVVRRVLNKKRLEIPRFFPEIKRSTAAVMIKKGAFMK